MTETIIVKMRVERFDLTGINYCFLYFRLGVSHFVSARFFSFCHVCFGILRAVFTVMLVTNRFQCCCESVQ